MIGKETWKVAVELNQSENLEFKIINIIPELE